MMEKLERKPKDPRCRWCRKEKTSNHSGICDHCWQAYLAKPHAQIMAEKAIRDARFDESRSKMMKEIWQTRRNRAGDTQNA